MNENGKTSISLLPIHTFKELSKTSFHNERKGGDKTGSNIDIRRIDFNEVLVGDEEVDLRKNIASKITGHDFTKEEFYQKGKCKVSKDQLRYEDGIKLRKDAILAFEVKVDYPGEKDWAKIKDGKIQLLHDEEPNPFEPARHFVWPIDEKKLNDWKKITTNFILDRFQKNNVEQIVLHMDESTPHIHAVVTPMIINEKGNKRLNMTKVVGGRKECAQLQTDYAKAVEMLGFQRGDFYSCNQNIGLNQARRMLIKDLRKKLPEDRALAEEMYQAALTQNNQLKLMLAEINTSAKTQSYLREEVNDLTKELNQYDVEFAEVRFEELGMHVLEQEDPEFIFSYKKAKEYIKKVGIEEEIYLNEIEIDDIDVVDEG